jgi:NAD(P)-dependent dehydrogenase (short-subunit alcohol dehydrogenase family)
MKGHEGKRAVVTGSAQGIGRAFATRLADDGVDVVAVDLTAPYETVAEIEARGVRGHAFVGDVADPDTAVRLADELDELGWRCDILVNNAGIYPMGTLEGLSYVDWSRMLSINLDSMFLLCKALVPAMRAAGWGRIVNMSTDVVNLHVTDSLHYTTSKAGVVGFTRALASEVGSNGVTVNAIAPSVVRTPSTADLADGQGPGGRSMAEHYEAVAQRQAIPRLSTAADLVGTLSFLTSDEAAFITAQTLFVDGGLVRGG